MRRYRRTLECDTRNESDEKRKRRRLGLTARIVERACMEKIVAKMNELAVHYRANKRKMICSAECWSWCSDPLKQC